MWRGKTLVVAVSALLIALCAHAAAARPTGASGELKPLVSTEWLAQNLEDPSLVLLHVGMKDRYEKQHIPGARLASVRAMIAIGPDSLHDEMPPVADLASQFSALGVSNDSRVVVCLEDAQLLPLAGRVFLTLEYLGMEGRVAVLDGGLQKWKAEKRALSSEAPSVAPARLEPAVREDLIVNGEWVAANLRNKDVALVDARPHESYAGRSEFAHGPRSGHIPGALSIPFDAVLAKKPNYVMKKKGDLEKLFRDAGVKDGSDVVVYCGTGIWAASVYLAARNLGYATRFYDAGFEEWSQQSQYPVTAPVDPGAVR